MKTTISQESREQALTIAKATQKLGQTKEQTKLIAQGIEKGIAIYKKQQKVQARERDKSKKKQLKQKSDHTSAALDTPIQANASSHRCRLPWLLLAISWLGFIAYTAGSA
ncbi:DUF2956 domain-containing protein [Shewanella sp. NIFS-20-20]|uniref:DUF2956 domain-containing protein n=1 Tax=Shewanella sp. NIFS-20-20 TaxID=2853806 RepID=UPI001C451C58|nr:DUF2956 domain-containing protein [Shewanella sp. NIFS-20-20]MBV7316486.1 DUF2956 domain-containing protein [Shewanella sp. NIFS-20-20]